MSTTERAEAGERTPLIELTDVGKSYGQIKALEGVNLRVVAGEVTCVLGDNGAGKSTLIKIMAGLHQHDAGTLRVLGQERRFASPREAQHVGIATVYQDLALAPMMSVWRNFFLGAELRRGPWLRTNEMRRIAKEELARMGIDIADVDRPVGGLSGGQKQCLAIARATYFGAKAVILDEPTASLGVKQSGVVLAYIARAREEGVGVVLITHNPHHAYLIGDHFVVLKRGRVAMDKPRAELTLERLTSEMAGGEDLAALRHELQRDHELERA